MNNELNTVAQEEQTVPLRPLRQPRLTIRISQGSLSFAVPDVAADHQIIFLPYTVRSGVSMAANLREAFRTEELLSKNWSRALVMLDTPYVLLPLDDYDEGDSQRNAIFYHHAITGHQNDVILTTVLPTLNAAVLFAINKDLKLVIDDHFPDVKFMPLSQPVWNHLHRRSFTGARRKLFGFFHDKRLEIFSYQQNRFRFCNSFEGTKAHDAAFFLLSVWQQLGMDQRKDEMHLVGTLPEREVILAELRRFVHNVYVINPTADFNRAPVTQIKGIPYDLIVRFATRV